jgi:histone-lysine N-methyltransferase SETMAR
VRISFGSVQAILIDVYGMSKVSARWVPRQLTDDQKRNRLDISRYLLSRYEDERDFIYWIVTQDETWVQNQNKINRSCSGSTLTHPSEEIQEGAISREDDGFNFYE